MKKVIKLTESDIKRIVKKVLIEQEEKETINEVIGLTAAILAYRQTALSKSNRLTKKIKRALKDRGINNKVIVGGNFHKLMSCINESVDSAGEHIKGSGSKNVDKSLVKNVKMITTKKKKEQSGEALQSFKEKFDSNIEYCSEKFKLSPETTTIIQDVMMDTIVKFQEKTFHI